MNDTQTAIQTAILTSLGYTLQGGVWERVEGVYRIRVELDTRFVGKYHHPKDRHVATANYFDLESFIVALGSVTDKF